MNATTALRRHWETVSQQPGWPEHGWPTLADARQRDDDTLTTLLCLHRDGDPRAGLVIAITCLNALVGRAHRLGLDPDDCLAALWVTLCRYPLATRPWRIHANVVLDATRDAARMRWARDIPFDPMVLDRWENPEGTDPDDDPSAGAVIAAGVHLGLVSDEDERLLRTISVDGTPVRHVAHECGTTLRAVQRRHQRAVRRLAPLREILCPAA